MCWLWSSSSSKNDIESFKRRRPCRNSSATGCMEVSTFIYPYTSWTDSFIHTAFECAGATLSGVEAAYKSMKKQGKLPNENNKIYRFWWRWRNL